MTDQLDPARPGRRRSEEARQAILAAALELTAEAGYARLTIDGIAARSGAGKQTIYRWWPSKDDVLLEAGAEKADLHVPIPDEGSYRADLSAFLTASFALGRQRQLTDVLRALMARAQIDNNVRAAFPHRVPAAPPRCPRGHPGPGASPRRAPGRRLSRHHHRHCVRRDLVPDARHRPGPRQQAGRRTDHGPSRVAIRIR